MNTQEQTLKQFADELNKCILHRRMIELEKQLFKEMSTNIQHPIESFNGGFGNRNGQPEQIPTYYKTVLSFY